MKTIILSVVLLSLFQSTAYAQYLNDCNSYNVAIPDDGEQVCSDLLLSGASAGAEITQVRVYYEIAHSCPGDLHVWLTTYYDGSWHDYTLYEAGELGCAPDNIVDDRSNLHTWDGASPNQEWFLCCRDNESADVGYIDHFELWIYYDQNQPPGAPYDEDPQDGETGVSIFSNLDWRCSDPDDDSVYYTVYFEKNDSTPNDVIKEDATGSSASLGTLDYDSHYYWKVKADDHNGGVTWGPESGSWDFYTMEEPVVDAEITALPISNVNGGESIAVTGRLTNTGNVSNGFGIGAEIWRGGSVVHTFDCQHPISLTPGQIQDVAVSFAIPSDWPADDYFARVVAWTGLCGASTWLDSDDEAFTVSPPVFPDIHGKIAFHRYTSDAAYDGQLFIADLDDGSLYNVSQYWNIDHAQSAHFSPDGTQMVFYGVPEGQHEYSSREIYLWDLTTGSPPPAWAHPTRLTNNSVPDEDPKFSFSGRYICYKSNQDLKIYDQVTQVTTSLTNNGWATEEWSPFFSSDDQYLFFTENTSENADIFKIKISDLSVVSAEGIGALQEYYPVVRADGSYFYTRWRAASVGSHQDQIYLRTATTNQPVAFNSPLYDFSDAYPVDEQHALFTSTRISGNSFDIFLGNIETGEIYNIPIEGINTPQMELGCCYSPNAALVSTLIGNISAKRERNGVVVRWKVTGGDSENTFNIYRNIAGQGTLLLNDEPIIAEADLEYFDECSDPGEIQYTLEYNNENNVMIWSSTIQVEGASSIPPLVARISAYPNPFNPQTVIEYSVPLPSQITVAVYDMRGQLVKTLRQGYETVGVKNVTWDGSTNDSSQASAGVYLVRMHAASFVAIQKITLVE